jgi:hypothetical protein
MIVSIAGPFVSIGRAYFALLRLPARVFLLNIENLLWVFNPPPGKLPGGSQIPKGSTWGGGHQVG